MLTKAEQKAPLAPVDKEDLPFFAVQNLAAAVLYRVAKDLAGVDMMGDGDARRDAVVAVRNGYLDVWAECLPDAEDIKRKLREMAEDRDLARSLVKHRGGHSRAA